MRRLTSDHRPLSPTPRPRARMTTTISLTVAIALTTLPTRAHSAPTQKRAHATTARAWLIQRLDALRHDPRLGGAKIGVLVAPTRRHAKPLFSADATRTVPVASNVKLITSATALAALGPEYRFTTAVYALGKRHGAVIDGDLGLKSFGDPSLTDGDLWRLARDLHAIGIREIRGSLRIDESYFDSQTLAPRYETRRTDAYYRPANGPLSINENVIRVRVRAGEREGDPAKVSCVPASRYLVIDSDVKTVRRGRRSWLGISTRKKGLRTRVRIRGRVRLGYHGRAWTKRVVNPGLFTAATFLDLLARRGIKITPKIRHGKIPRRKRALVVHRSRPLGEIVHYMNKVSSNFMAEQLLKVLGAERFGTPGTWENGLKVVTAHLASVGVAPGTYTLKNGSGLYDASAISPEQIVKVLRAAYYDFRYGPDYFASLSIAGVDGTLAHRLIGSGAERYVRAKTGTLAHVVAMSGMAGAHKSRRRLFFSFLVSKLPPRHIHGARAVVDAMARALVTYLER